MKEGAENQPVLRSSTISGDELYERITPNGIVDTRFISKEEGGVFHFSPLGRDSDIHVKGMHYSIVEENGKIVAVAEIEQSPYDESELWLKSVSVDETLKGGGLSEKILKEVFRYVQTTGKKLKLSKYTQEGEERLSRRIEALTKEFGIEVIPA